MSHFDWITRFRLILSALGFFVSIFLLIARRIFPENDLKVRCLGSFTPRNDWHLHLDFIVELLQSHRDLFSKHLDRYRLADYLHFPTLGVGVQIAKVQLTTSYGTTLSGEWISPQDELDSSRAILYFHGGAFCFCSINTHRYLISRIARASRTRVFVFGYRRAPEFQYPCQIEDGIEAYQYMMSVSGGSYRPENVIFAGDSAGGCMALAVALHLKMGDRPLPKGLAMMSPWADLTVTSESWSKNHGTDFLPSAQIAKDFANFYVPTSLKADDPLISPCFADLTSFPPMYIQVSDSEQLYDDSVTLYKKATQCGVNVKMDVFNYQPHVFQAFGGTMANQAISMYGSWILSNWQTEKLTERCRSRSSEFRMYLSNEIF